MFSEARFSAGLEGALRTTAASRFAGRATAARTGAACMGCGARTCFALPSILAIENFFSASIVQMPSTKQRASSSDTAGACAETALPARTIALIATEAIVNDLIASPLRIFDES
jgi:hypothetical protein